MAIKSNPADFVTRWRAGVQAAGGRYVQGIQQSQDWAAAATAPAAVSARNAGLSRAMANGTIERGIQNLGTTGWRNAAVAKAQNWQVGVNSPMAQQKAQAGAVKLFGFLQAGESAIAGLPRGGIDENIARFTTWARAVHDASQASKA
jgi:hypothetical protein